MLCKLQTMKHQLVILRGKLDLEKKVEQSSQRSFLCSVVALLQEFQEMITICQEFSCRQNYIDLRNAINQILLLKREGECSLERIL